MGVVQGMVAAIEEMMPSWKELPAVEAANIPGLSGEADSVRSSLILERHKLARAEENAKAESSKVEAFLSEHSEYDRAALKALSEYSVAVISEIERRHREASERIGGTSLSIS